MPQEKKSTLGISPNKSRCIYQQGTKLELMCRVCLTKSNNSMYDLCETLPFKEDLYSNPNLNILEALEKITASKISLHRSPRYICPMCFSILKISFKFIIQFEVSQKKLKEILGENELVFEVKNSNSTEYTQNRINCDSVAPVELIIGENKYSLNDLLVVEKPEEENCDFSGFLNNLGSEVSALFADEYEAKPHLNENDENQITLSLVEKDKVMPLKEVQIDEETNTVQFVIDDDFDNAEEEMRFEIESDVDGNNECITQSNNKSNVEYVNKNDYEDDSISECIRIEVEDFDLDALAFETGSKKIYEKGVNKLKNNSKVKGFSDDEFEKEMKFPCDICGKIYEFLHRLKAHKKRTHFKELKVYYCDICGYKNNTLSAHKHHKTKHVGKKWVCEICSKSYYTKAVLKVHMVTHTDNRHHLCTVCGKGFQYANALVYHMRLHTGEKNYLCKYCGRKFRMPNSLNRHIRCHTDERPYQCRFCDKAFRSKGEVNCHETGHTGLRPYHCKYCRKGFSKAHNMKLHLLSHGGPHTCELCSRNFIEPTILTMHYKISHQDVTERKSKAKDEEGEEESNEQLFYL